MVFLALISAAGATVEIGNLAVVAHPANSVAKLSSEVCMIFILLF
jgi:hypothetical protein